MSLIYIIEDEPILADCIALGLDEQAKGEYRINTYNNAISAIEAMNDEVPDVILLDVLLGGPDGFTMLNELISYPDTARIPVVIITSLKLQLSGLEHYGVVEILDKAKMTPEDIYAATKNALEIGKRVEFQAQKPQPPVRIPETTEPESKSKPQLPEPVVPQSQEPTTELDAQPALPSPAQSPNINPGTGLAELNQKLSSANEAANNTANPEPHAD